MKLWIKILIVLLILTLIATGSLFYFKNKYETSIKEPNSNISAVVKVDIEPGMDIKSISSLLQEKGVIQNADIFYWYLKFEKLGPSIQAGIFYIPQNLTVIQVAEILQVAAGDDVWISFQEGLRMDEIADQLEVDFITIGNENFNKEEFGNIVTNPDSYELENEFILNYKPEKVSLEGFIFPDTYNVNKDISTQELIELFLSTFETKITKENVLALEQTKEGFYGSLTLASIIEREGRTPEEKNMIAHILLERIRNGVEDGTKSLQTDATLLYLQKDWLTPVTEDLKNDDNPYNTYMHPGLPPTPISNPGLTSIEAVINPTSNNYLYYLHGNDGQIHYAEIYSEHEINQRCYIHENHDYCP